MQEEEKERSLSFRISSINKWSAEVQFAKNKSTAKLGTTKKDAYQIVQKFLHFFNFKILQCQIACFNQPGRFQETL